MNYVVCQTPRCQQTYPLEYFGEVTKDTKNISCDKCGGVLIDKDGRANFSTNPDVIPVISINELEEIRQSELNRKRKELKYLTKQIRELENNSYS